MLYNKNNVRKTNDKKILHKVGKQWKVVSVALLMAIGGGAAVAATNNNANAQSTNGASVGVQSEAADLENDNYKAPQSASASSQAPSSSAKAPSLANVNYAPSARVYGNNASAASYHNHANFDQARIDYYGPTVKHYVNSINAKYPEANSLANNVASAKNATNNDNSLASSYAATAKDPAASSVVSGLALKAGLTTSAYIDSVMYEQQGLATAVSNGSNEANTISYGASLANTILNGNPEVSSAQAQVAYDEASANLNVATATSLAHSNVVSAVNSANNANENALNKAKSQSLSASVSATVAQIYSGIDAATVNSLAYANSNKASDWNSSAVSASVSAVASYANAFGSFNNSGVFEPDFSASGINYSANDSNMQRVISDTAVLSAQAKISSSAASVIANANAYKLAHANDLSSAQALQANDSAAMSSANSAFASAALNENIANFVSSGIALNGNNNVAFANSLLNDAKNLNGLKASYATTFENNLRNNSAAMNSLKTEAKSAVANEYANSANVRNNAKEFVENALNVTANAEENIVEGAKSQAANMDKVSGAAYLNSVISEANDVKNNATNSAENEFKGSLEASVSASLGDLNNPASLKSDIAADPALANLKNSLVNSAKSAVLGDLGNEGINVSAFGGHFSNASKAASDFANTVLSKEASLATNNNGSYVAAGTSANLSDAVSLAESSAASAYNSVVSASNSYSDVTDQDVTLASYFASSYTNAASSEANTAVSDANVLNNYYVDTAANDNFTNAFNNYNIAKGEISNEKTLAHAFGVNVLHHCPQFVTVTKNAVLHTGVGFTKKNAVKSVKAGAQLAVKGVGFDEVGTLRYVVGTDDGQPVYLTANDAYVENSYLEPDGAATVKFNKSANAHKGLNFNSKVVGSVKAGQTVTGNIIATLSDNSYDHYFGVARLQLSDGSFVTANKSYFSVIPTAKNNNNDHSESYKANNNYNRDLVLFK